MNISRSRTIVTLCPVPKRPESMSPGFEYQAAQLLVKTVSLCALPLFGCCSTVRGERGILLRVQVVGFQIYLSPYLTVSLVFLSSANSENYGWIACGVLPYRNQQNCLWSSREIPRVESDWYWGIWICLVRNSQKLFPSPHTTWSIREVLMTVETYMQNNELSNNYLRIRAKEQKFKLIILIILCLRNNENSNQFTSLMHVD